ncbi:hypothetical protein Tco_0097909 [Tanacetum coccineum]
MDGSNISLKENKQPTPFSLVEKEVVSPSVVDEAVVSDKQSPLVNDTGLGSFTPLPTQETPSASNAPGKSSYANVTGKPSEKKLNIRTLFTPGGNGIDVVVSVESIRAISKRFANTAYGFFLGKRVACPVVTNYVKLHSVHVTAFSKDGLSAIATKLGTPLMLDSYTSDMCMQSWGRSGYARAMIELRADVELKDNIVVAMPKIIREGFYICNVRVECVGEKKTLRKPSQTSRGVPVGPKIGFKPQKEYRHVPKKLLLALAVIRRKMWNLLLRYQWGNTNLVNNGATSSGSSLKKVEYPGDYDSEDEVTSVDNDMARSMASERVGFVTQSLLKLWRDSYGNGNYDEDPYDDDMYECHDLP